MYIDVLSCPQHLDIATLSPVAAPTIDARGAVSIGSKPILEAASPRRIKTFVHPIASSAPPIVARAPPCFSMVGCPVLHAADVVHVDAAEIFASPCLEGLAGGSWLSRWGWSGENAEAEAHDCVENGSLHVWWLCLQTKVSTQKGER
jgi:hypothetical protein